MLTLYLALIDEPSGKEKFVQIYNAYKSLMFRVAMSVLHNPALAEEAVQESFLKIAKKISYFSEPVCSKSASLIVIIVRNTSIDCLRKEKPGTALPYDEAIDISQDIQMPDITDILPGGIGTLTDIINSMDKIYGDVLKLKYIYGYSNSEIGELLGITAKNVNMRAYRARFILKTKLEENGYAFK